MALRSRLRTWAQQTFGDPYLWNYTAYIQELGKKPPPQAQVPNELKRARLERLGVGAGSRAAVSLSPAQRHETG